MRFISTRMHGILDYVTGGALLAAPELFKLKDVPKSALTPRIAGGSALGYSMLTNYEMSPKKLLPMRMHLALDAGSGLLLAASPWLLGYKKRGMRYWLPHVLVGGNEIAVAMLTKTQPSNKEQSA